MKKVLGILLASTLVLGACGKTNESQSNKVEAVNENKAQFKNNTLVIDDAVLTIKDAFIVNDKNSEDKLLAFKYEVKNKTNKEEITPFNVWLATMKAKQDDTNTISDLEMGMTPITGEFEKWHENSDSQIKKGKSAKGIVTYALKNDNDVTLEGSKGSDGKLLGSKKITLSDLKTVDYDASSDLNNGNDNGDVASIDESSNNMPSESSENNVTVNTDSKDDTKTNSDATNTNKPSEKSTNNNDYMTDSEIAEWNKTKPTTHDESQMQGVGGHPSGFDASIPKETQGVPKTDSNGEEYIDATGE